MLCSGTSSKTASPKAWAARQVIGCDKAIDIIWIAKAKLSFRPLRFLIAHSWSVYSRQQLLDNVWGDHLCLEDGTVNIHIRSLRVALGAAAEQIIETVRDADFKLVVGRADARLRAQGSHPKR